MRHHFVRSLAGSRDPNFKNVTLLLHGDGTNGGQNNTFLDSGPNNLTITRSGNVPQGSFSPYGDRWSVALAGSSAHLRSANNANLNIGSSDFTFECWANGSSFSTDWATFFGRWNSSGNYGYFFNYDTDGGLTFIYSTTGLAAGNVIRVYGGTMTVGKWHHVAFCRSGGTTRAFLDGVQIGSATSDNVTIFNSNGQQVIGGVLDAATIYHPFTGYISNLRLVIGTALYTSNFTPSSSPLTVIANTRILACASNRFEDKSPTALTLNPNGTPSVQPFSPFGPDAEYRKDRIWGSGYFDGSGDSLSPQSSVNLNVGAGHFTIEGWIYPTALGGWRGVYVFGPGIDDGLYISPSNTISIYRGGVLVQSSAAVPLNAWSHVAATRDSSNNVRVFLNGVASNAVNSTYSFNHNSPRIGARLDNLETYAGYISNLRLIKGTAMYTSNFTVPTSPVTANHETQLLLNFTNASIVDNAMMHNIETVADAQIDTTQKKFGTGALEFDGNGDYLNFRTGGNLLLGTGDFTVELWFYARASRTHRLFSLDGSGPSSFYAGLRIDLNGSGTFGLYSSNGGSHNIITDQGSWSVNTWTHLAITRSGNDFRFFKNGTQFYTVNSTHGLMNGTSHTIGMLASYGADWFDGLIDDFRVTRDVARYTSNFTPPTAPFPDF